MMIKNIFGHLRTILRHKRYVLKYCVMAGIPWRGIVHDLSKFSPVEFIESVKFYQGGKASPIPVVKKINGYSEAWQHHKGRNRHHYEYWVDCLDDGGVPIKMPYNDLKELICDYLGAARSYSGDSFSFRGEYFWWVNKISNYNIAMHNETKDFITAFFKRIMDADTFTYKDFDEVRKEINY